MCPLPQYPGYATAAYSNQLSVRQTDWLEDCQGAGRATLALTRARLLDHPQPVRPSASPLTQLQFLATLTRMQTELQVAEQTIHDT